MKVIVFGGRDYTRPDNLWAVLDKIHAETPITELIHGDARGADRLGRDWAISRNVLDRPFPANWATYGKAAGFRRNQLMVDAMPNLAVQCPGGRGTADMRRRLDHAHIEVVEA